MKLIGLRYRLALILVAIALLPGCALGAGLSKIGLHPAHCEAATVWVDAARRAERIPIDLEPAELEVIFHRVQLGLYAVGFCPEP